GGVRPWPLRLGPGRGAGGWGGWAAAGGSSPEGGALNPPFESLIEGAEVRLGPGDGLTGERDEDTAEGLGLREASMPAEVFERELVDAVENTRHDEPADPAQQHAGLRG